MSNDLDRIDQAQRDLRIMLLDPATSLLPGDNFEIARLVNGRPRLMRAAGSMIAGIAPAAPLIGATNLLASQSGAMFTNTGAVAVVPLTLPVAALGLVYGFAVTDIDGIRVIAQAGQTIRVGATVSAAGGRIDATAIGSVVWLSAVSLTEWYAWGREGVWTAT